MKANKMTNYTISFHRPLQSSQGFDQSWSRRYLDWKNGFLINLAKRAQDKLQKTGARKEFPCLWLWLLKNKIVLLSHVF